MIGNQVHLDNIKPIGNDRPGGNETQESIYQWARKTFGPVGSNLQIAKRAMEEMEEILDVLGKDDNDPAVIEEIADVLIVLSQIPERMGYDLQSAINGKMAINRKRQWITNGDGTGQHKD